MSAAPEEKKPEGKKPEEKKKGQAWTPKTNKWLVSVVVTLAAFMEILDTTIINVSLPHIAGTMSVSYDNATWTLTSYLIANGIVLTVSGWLARVIGRKRYFLICIGMFTVCSLICGVAVNLPMLILARLAQGFFGGGLQPTQQSIILDYFSASERSRAFAVTAIATVVAPVIGPSLGGWITDSYSWRWIFFLNLPVGALAFFGVMQLVEDPPWSKAQGVQGIDYIGLSLITLGLGALQVVMDRGEDSDWFGSPTIVTFACLAFVGIFGAIAWLLYAEKPVVNIRLLGERNFAICSILMVLMAATLYGSVVVIPQLAQRVLGYDATLAGLVLSPGALLVIVLIPISTGLQKLISTKWVVVLGFSLLGCAMIYSHRLTPDISFEFLVYMRAAQATGLAFLFAPLTTMALSKIGHEDSGDASALFTMFRNVSGSIGISVSTAMITERTQVRMAHLSAHASPLDQGYQGALQQVQQALVAHGGVSSSQQAAGILYRTFGAQASVLAYMDVFAFCAIMAFAAVPIALLLGKDSGGGKNVAAH